jgi:2-polyprenyl-6-methoxyphenol hydroxylase-like FAD-dependent oxidoreductase
MLAILSRVRAPAYVRDTQREDPDIPAMGGIAAMRDAIVVGLGPAGAATATMLREPGAFNIAGQALDVLAVEARSAIPTRGRVVAIQQGGLTILEQADRLLGHTDELATAPSGVASIRRVESTFRDAMERVGVETRYDTRIAGIEDHGRAGVTVTFEDGSTERARYVVDATGGRLGPFTWDAPAGETIYLTGQLPPMPDAGSHFVSWDRVVKVHGAGNDRAMQPVFGFNDAHDGATAFVQFPSLPPRSNDAHAAHRLLRRYLIEAGYDPRGLRDAQYIVTPHVRVPDAVNGSLIAVGDTVRRLSPRTAQGVSNAIVDAKGAAWAIQDVLAGRRTAEASFHEYSLAASRR